MAFLCEMELNRKLFDVSSPEQNFTEKAFDKHKDIWFRKGEKIIWKD